MNKLCVFIYFLINTSGKNLRMVLQLGLCIHICKSAEIHSRAPQEYDREVKRVDDRRR